MDKLKIVIFKEIKELLKEYEGRLEVRSDTNEVYHLYGTKEVQVGKKLHEGMYFASVMIKKGFVGFYFFPIYTHPAEFENLDEPLMNCMKGKSCFNIKKNDTDIYKGIKKALKKGYSFYKKINYI